MKSVTLLTTLMLSLCASANAALYEYNQTFNNSSIPPLANGGVVLDGNMSGLFDTRTVSGVGGPIVSVSVSLNVTGGYNGDLYAYLSYNGALIPLLNRVGVTAGNS